MSITIELPPETEQLLREEANRRGMKVSDLARALVEDNLPSWTVAAKPTDETLDKALAGFVGAVNSGGVDRLSERCGEKFTDHLKAKRRNGHL